MPSQTKSTPSTDTRPTLKDLYIIRQNKAKNASVSEDIETLVTTIASKIEELSPGQKIQVVVTLDSVTVNGERVNITSTLNRIMKAKIRERLLDEGMRIEIGSSPKHLIYTF